MTMLRATPSLLRSQLDTLAPLEPDEPGVRVDTAGDPDAIAERALAELELHEHAGRPGDDTVDRGGQG